MKLGRRVLNAPRRGSAMVESALVLLVLLATLTGIFDMGQVLFLHQFVTDRTRSAARWATVQPTWDATQVENMVMYGTATVPAGRNASTGVFGMSRTSVTARRVSWTTPDGTTEWRVEVIVERYPFHFLSPWIAGARTGKRIVSSIPYEGSA